MARVGRRTEGRGRLCDFGGVGEVEKKERRKHSLKTRTTPYASSPRPRAARRGGARHREGGGWEGTSEGGMGVADARRGGVTLSRPRGRGQRNEPGDEGGKKGCARSSFFLHFSLFRSPTSTRRRSIQGAPVCDSHSSPHTPVTFGRALLSHIHKRKRLSSPSQKKINVGSHQRRRHRGRPLPHRRPGRGGRYDRVDWC